MMPLAFSHTHPQSHCPTSFLYTPLLAPASSYSSFYPSTCSMITGTSSSTFSSLSFSTLTSSSPSFSSSSSFSSSTSTSFVSPTLSSPWSKHHFSTLAPSSISSTPASFVSCRSSSSSSDLESSASEPAPSSESHLLPCFRVCQGKTCNKDKDAEQILKVFSTFQEFAIVSTKPLSTGEHQYHPARLPSSSSQSLFLLQPCGCLGGCGEGPNVLTGYIDLPPAPQDLGEQAIMKKKLYKPRIRRKIQEPSAVVMLIQHYLDVLDDETQHVPTSGYEHVAPAFQLLEQAWTLKYQADHALSNNNATQAIQAYQLAANLILDSLLPMHPSLIQARAQTQTHDDNNNNNIQNSPLDPQLLADMQVVQNTVRFLAAIKTNQAQAYLDIAQLDAALDAANIAIDCKPDHAPAWYRKALAHANKTTKEDLDLATQACKVIIRLTTSPQEDHSTQSQAQPREKVRGQVQGSGSSKPTSMADRAHALMTRIDTAQKMLRDAPGAASKQNSTQLNNRNINALSALKSWFSK